MINHHYSSTSYLNLHFQSYSHFGFPNPFMNTFFHTIIFNSCIDPASILQRRKWLAALELLFLIGCIECPLRFPRSEIHRIHFSKCSADESTSARLLPRTTHLSKDIKLVDPARHSVRPMAFLRVAMSLVSVGQPLPPLRLLCTMCQWLHPLRG